MGADGQASGCAGPGQGDGGGEVAAGAFEFCERQVARSGGRPVSGTGDPGAVVLLGGHGVEPGLHDGPDRRDGLVLVEERDGVFELAAVAGQLVGGEGVQRVLGLLYCGGLV
jgi:hypothetical protein